MPERPTYAVEIEAVAWSAIMALPQRTQDRIFAAIEDLEADPRASGTRKLKGYESTYRVRVGDYRVLYKIEDNRLVVVVVKVAERKYVYR